MSKEFYSACAVLACLCLAAMLVAGVASAAPSLTPRFESDQVIWYVFDDDHLVLFRVNYSLSEAQGHPVGDYDLQTLGSDQTVCYSHFGPYGIGNLKAAVQNVLAGAQHDMARFGDSEEKSFYVERRGGDYSITLVQPENERAMCTVTLDSAGMLDFEQALIYVEGNCGNYSCSPLTIDEECPQPTLPTMTPARPADDSGIVDFAPGGFDATETAQVSHCFAMEDTRQCINCILETAEVYEISQNTPEVQRAIGRYRSGGIDFDEPPTCMGPCDSDAGMYCDPGCWCFGNICTTFATPASIPDLDSCSEGNSREECYSCVYDTIDEWEQIYDIAEDHLGVAVLRETHECRALPGERDICLGPCDPEQGFHCSAGCTCVGNVCEPGVTD